MTYLTLTIPDNPAEQRHWLEGIIARGEASRFASEQAVVQECTLTATALPADMAAFVCERGLTGLSDAQIQELLQHPSLLLALAEEVLLNGGDYWTQRLARETVFDDRVSRGRSELLQALAPTTVRPATPAGPHGRNVSVRFWLTSLAASVFITASLMVFGFNALGTFPRSQPTGPTTDLAWGWQKSNELAAIDDPAAYLERIAALADEWHTRDKSTPRALADAIADFRQGCAHLQLREHKPLSDAQRKDLLAKCQKWAKKFDQSLADLETTGDLAAVTATMNATVTQLQTTLRTQAAQLRAG